MIIRRKNIERSISDRLDTITFTFLAHFILWSLLLPPNLLDCSEWNRPNPRVASQKEKTELKQFKTRRKDGPIAVYTEKDKDGYYKAVRLTGPNKGQVIRVKL